MVSTNITLQSEELMARKQNPEEGQDRKPVCQADTHGDARLELKAA
jgi:hypothetical protein